MTASDKDVSSKPPPKFDEGNINQIMCNDTDMVMYPMLAQPRDGKGQVYLPLRRKFLWAAPALGWYALKYHKGGYMKKFFVDDYPAASLGIIALSTTISVLVDAFTDPKMAKVTDNCESQYGRRRPFIIASAFFIPLVFMLHWIPLVPSGIPASLWFAVFHIGFKLADTLFLIPFDAWGAQLTPSSSEQTSIFMWREIFANIGLFLGIAVLPMLFGNGDECSSTPSDGCTRAPLIAAFFSMLFVISCFALAYFGREPSFQALQHRQQCKSRGVIVAHGKQSFSANDTVPSLMATFLNAPFRAVLLSVMTKALGKDIPFAILPFMVEWVIGQKCMSSDTAFGLLALTNITATLIALPVFALLAKKIGKFKAYVVFNVLIAFALLLQFFHGTDTGDCTRTYAAFPLVFIFGFAMGGSFLTSSIVTDCIGYDEILTGGRRREAMYLMTVEFLPEFMNIPGEVLPLLLMAAFNYSRPSIQQPACSVAAEYFGGNVTRSFDDACTAYYKMEPLGENWCSQSIRCTDILANGAGFVCNDALETCGVVQNENVIWTLRIFFSIVPAIFIFLGTLPLYFYPSNNRTNGQRDLRGNTQAVPVATPAPTLGILAYFWPSELFKALEKFPLEAEKQQQATLTLSNTLLQRPLLWVLVNSLLTGAGFMVVMSDIDNLADDLGASLSPLGLVLVGFGLVGFWFHGSRAQAAWKLRFLSVARSEIVLQYNAFCPFIGQPPLDEMDTEKQTTMLAACYHKHGRPSDVVQVRRVLRPPTPGSGQLLVRVKAASLNPADWKTGRGGQAGLLHFDWPRVYGFDFSGVVVAVGLASSEMEQDQHEFRDGDLVFGMICGLPEANRGTLAEYVLVDSSVCARCPPDTSHIACASLPLVAITATKALQACSLVEGEKSQGGNDNGPRVLITGGAGGVGSIAIQLAVKLFNASFVATTASAGVKTELCRRLGASQVINYREDDFQQVLANSNEALLFDAIVDCTDEATKCVPLLKKGGALVSITEGPTQEALVTWFTEAHVDPSKITIGVRPFLFSQVGGALFEFFSGARKLRGACEARGARFAHVIGTGDGQIMAKVAELLANKSIEPVIDREFPLLEAVSAIEYQALGHTAGKVVITIEDSSGNAVIEPLSSALAQDPLLSV